MARSPRRHPTPANLVKATPLVAGSVALGYRRIRARLGFWHVTALMFLLIGIGYLLIARADSYPGVLPGLFISGLGLGMLFPTSNVWVSTLAPERLRGRALGGLTTAVYLGQFLSPLLVQPDRLGGLAAGYLFTGVTVVALALALGLVLVVGARRNAPDTAGQRWR